MKIKLLVYLVGIAILFSNPHLEAAAAGAYSVGRTKTIPSNSAAILDPSKLIFLEVTGGLSSPIFITNAGDGSGRLFVVERHGQIRIIESGSLLATPFLDIQSKIKAIGGEQGLLTLAFHPDYENNGLFFVAYTAALDGNPNGSNLILEKYSVSDIDPDQADPNSGIILLTIPHPDYSNHNGGTLAFDQNGFLYWSTGDGGSGGDPSNNAQNLESLLGKILRIDVDSGPLYGIPSSNPFFDESNPNIKKEIWAYGLRNPWRMSFDRLTGDLYIGDVGQSTREEVDFQPVNDPGGINYGWRIMEGSLCYNPSNGCDQTGKTPPIAEYDHTLGCSIIGGYVYRGDNYSSLYGSYLYADICSGIFFSLQNNSGWEFTQLIDTSYGISTFGEDEKGEIYFADLGTGKIYSIGYDEPFYTISGNAGINDAILSYTDGTPKAEISQANGDYTLQVSSGWSGTVTPSKPCYAFTPSDRSYNNVLTNQVSQNYLPSFAPPDQVCITAISRADQNPTNSTNVNFNVSFNVDVMGVDSDGSDFSLTTSGVSGATITGVTPVSDATYTVSVDTGSGSGTIRLDVLANATITNLSSNPLEGLPYTDGETYTISVSIGKVSPSEAATGLSLSPTLSWGSSPYATAYEYCYSSAPGPCTNWVSTGANTSVTLNNLASNYPYYWQVRALNSYGAFEADSGNWWSFTTVNTPVCSWPEYTPPISPTFADVPMNVTYWSWVERLSNGGITAGCGSGNFCPGDAVNRAEMAIFLLRGMYCGSTYTPPAVGGSTGFNDVPTNVTYAPWIKQLAVDGVTAGCGDGNFCPGDIVNRAQMAIFLLRAKHGGTFSPPGVDASSGFSDVPADTSYAPWVKQLATEGVTAGCGNGNFCPADTVNRAQMAIFLVRAFGLP